MLNHIQLVGQNRIELNTELRFIFASAKVDGVEILKIDLPTLNNDKDNARLNGCVIKVLRTLKKENVIEFYVNREGFAANSTEAIYLLNKFPEYINGDLSDTSSIYVKI